METNAPVKKDYSGSTWYKELTTAFQSLAHALDIEPSATSELQAFLVQKCREQYNTGNKSGIAWERKRQAGQGNPGTTVRTFATSAA